LSGFEHYWIATGSLFFLFQSNSLLFMDARRGWKSRVCGHARECHEALSSN
jgi:hypothetical protein